MFGYVIPLNEELKVKEYNTFRSYYCGLCREIGSKSQISRLTLTFDMTFLALVLSSVYLESESGIRKFCPFKMKKVMMISSNPFSEYAADMNIILSNRKLIDNYRDDGNFLALAASKFIATRGLSEYARSKIHKIDYNLNMINSLENLKCNNVDEVGHYFAELTGEVFDIGEGANSRILKTLGYNLGKWIYTIDAFDDIERDIEKKKYNPFIYAFNHSGEDGYEFKERIKDNVKFTLIKCLDEISKAFEVLEVKKNRGIIENIVYMGMEHKTACIMEGRCNNDKSIRGSGSKRGCF